MARVKKLNRHVEIVDSCFGPNSQLFSCFKTEFHSAHEIKEDDLRASYLSLVSSTLALAVIDEKALRKLEAIDLQQEFQKSGITNFPHYKSATEYNFCRNADSDLGRILADCVTPVARMNITGDYFSSLHHSFFSSISRRSKGEFYTPQWMCEKMVQHILEDHHQTICDPACGTGSFLIAAINLKLDSGISPADILQQIQGYDNSPLAVHLCKANIIINLRSHFRRRESENINIPVKNIDFLHQKTFESRFDRVVGNPPWLLLRNTSASGQKVIKNIAKRFGLLSNSAITGNNVTNLDMAISFFLKSSQDLLKTKGKIAFVLPHSFMDKDQNLTFRELLFNDKYDIYPANIWDVAGIEQLFPVAAAILFAERGNRSKKKIPGLIATGKYGDHPECELKWKKTSFKLNQLGSRNQISNHTDATWKSSEENYYYTRFVQGATLVPRAFWFISRQSREADLNMVTTSITNRSGPDGGFKDLILHDNIDSRYVFSTVLGSDVVSFSAITLRHLVLPLQLDGDRVEFVRDYQNQEWIHKRVSLWNDVKGEKAASMNLFQRLDFHKGLSNQNNRRYLVIYPNLQRRAIAVVIDRESLVNTESFSNRFIVDTSFYHYQTDDRREAFYLTGILNSVFVDEKLTPFRQRYQKTQPNVHKKILASVRIPVFDKNNLLHGQIANQCDKCKRATDSFLTNLKQRNLSIGRLRNLVREDIKAELAELNELVNRLFYATENQ